MNPSIITAVIAVCAIISPIITAIINNRYNLKMKELEINRSKENEAAKHLSELREQTLIHLGACILNPTFETLSGFSEYYALAFLVFPKSVHSHLTSLNQEISTSNWDNAMDEYEELALKLSKELEL